jgi:hypothetical protein
LPTEPDLTTWQQIGALVGTAAAAIGIGRATKKDDHLLVVDAIEKMQEVIGREIGGLRLDVSGLRTDIRILLDRGERVYAAEVEKAFHEGIRRGQEQR